MGKLNLSIIKKKLDSLGKSDWVTPPKKPFKKKSSSDWITRDYLRRKKIKDYDPLRNLHPRRKGAYRIMNNERQEIKDILYPFIDRYIHSRLTFKKMGKTLGNDKRRYLIEFFNPSTSTNKQDPHVHMGFKIIDQIFKENEEKFTKDEIINTLINIVYRHRIDYLSFFFKKFVNSPIDKNKSLSIWNKISENCHA